MLTIVLVGASTTRQWGGRVYTPRGYAGKWQDTADGTFSGMTP
jgi:precorrin-3B methylase